MVTLTSQIVEFRFDGIAYRQKQTFTLKSNIKAKQLKLQINLIKGY